jgi:hypothetical protein
LKTLSQQTLLGQQGINLIERRLQEMGYWWYPSTVPEVRDGQTGRMTNLTLKVQSKATERPWPRERDDSFDYICEEEDLQYWLAGDAQVLLVMSRPSKEEAYWRGQDRTGLRTPVKGFAERPPLSVRSRPGLIR